jgi:peptide/nickel transport system permease protein
MFGWIPDSATPEDAVVRLAPRRRLRWTSRGVVRGTPAALAGLALNLVLVGVAALAGRLAPDDPFRSVAAPLMPPSLAHPMGTDDLGRDVLGGVIHGARTSLVVTLSVTALAALVGVTVGALSGFGAGGLDDGLMRLTEFVQVVPRFFLAVVVIALFGAGTDRLVLVLGLTSWPQLARVVRAETLTLRARAFVEAARSLGAPEPRVLLRHVLPGVLPAIVVIVSLNAAGVILLESSLAFIGLGDPHVMSWGYLASNAQRFLRVAWWMAAFPGAAIALAVLGLNLLGDSVNDMLRVTAPRTRRSLP